MTSRFKPIDVKGGDGVVRKARCVFRIGSWAVTRNLNSYGSPLRLTHVPSGFMLPPNAFADPTDRAELISAARWLHKRCPAASATGRPIFVPKRSIATIHRAVVAHKAMWGAA